MPRKEGEPRISHFIWTRSRQGYEITETKIDALTDDGYIKVPTFRRKDWFNFHADMESYRPFETEKLTEDFFQLNSDPDSILQFINKYGFPTFGERRHSKCPPDLIGRRNPSETIEGEEVCVYQVEDSFTIMKECGPAFAVSRISRALNLEFENEIFDELEKLCSIENGMFKINDLGFGPSSRTLDDFHEDFNENPLINAAWGYCQWAVSEGLHRNKVNINLLAYKRQATSRTSTKLFLLPSTLVGMIWLYLAEAIASSRGPLRCVVCGNFFRASRKDAKTCGAACRKALSRSKSSVTTVSLR